MFGLTGLRLYGAIGAILMMTLFLAWVWRIDGLRARHKQDYEECKTAHAQFVADVRAKTELARKIDAAHKAEVERNQDRISQESDNEIRRKVATAVAAARGRMQLNISAAHSSSSGSSPVPSPPNPAISVAGASEAAVVSAADLAVCTSNTILAEGWQDWWKNISAVPR